MSNTDNKPEYLRESYKALLPKLLEEAMDLYGDKTEYIFNEINYEFGFGDPAITYPDAAILEPESIIVDITLDNIVLTNYNIGVFQLAHEVIHLLSPICFNEKQITNNLEEGLAVYFSKMVTERDTGDKTLFEKSKSQRDYMRAYKLVKQLLDFDKEAIKKIRIFQPEIRKITNGNFKQAKIDSEKNLINELLKTFPRNDER